MARSFIRARQLLRWQGPLLALIALMVLIFFAQNVSYWYVGLMAVPGEIMASLENLRAGEASAADWGRFGTLLSCAFLHGSFEHIVYNMLFFWIFGALLSELLGWRWMLAIFVITAIAGSVTHTGMNRTDFIPMLGASGAVMGFEGAYLGLAVRYALPDPHVWPIARPIPPGRLALIAVLGIVFDYWAILQGQDTGIAYGAHVGGFTMGLLIAALAAPRPAAAGFRR